MFSVLCEYFESLAVNNTYETVSLFQLMQILFIFASGNFSVNYLLLNRLKNITLMNLHAHENENRSFNSINHDVCSVV